MRIIHWIVKNIILPFFITIIGGILVILMFFRNFPTYYYWAFLTEIYIFLFVFIFLIIFSFYYDYKESKEFKTNFPVYKIISKLKPADFGIFNYYETYIHRESDTEAEKSLKEKGMAFITGKPGIGKTRGALEVAKKYKDYYILKPTYEKIEIQNLRFPLLFSRKKVILFLDDLEKYAGKFGLDELIAVLKKNCKELKVLATCRTGKEFDQAFGQKEMGILLSQCRSNKVVPRILKEEEERELAEGVGKNWGEVTSDGTPGSIVLGLDQMEKRYKDLGKELKIILCVLKLLREAYIFIWAENIVKNIAKSKIFNLEGIPYDWGNWLRNLQENGFIEKSASLIRISHDSYLDNEFMTECHISNETLITLKNVLFNLNDAENLFNLGHTFDYRKNLNEGIDCYNKSIQINPFNAATHNNLGNLLYGLKNYAEAEKEYKEAVRINPEDAEVHISLGNLLKDVKRYDEAEKEYKEALRINPDLTSAHNNLSILYGYLKRYPEAEKEYREAVRINPNDAKIYIKLGNLLRHLKRYSEAEKEYREAIRINPNYYLGHNNLGTILFILENYPEAEKEYREAIKLNPHSIEAHNNLSNLLKHTGRYPEVEKEYREDLRVRTTKNIWLLSGILSIIIIGLLLFWSPLKEKESNSKIPPSPMAGIDSDKRYPETEKELREFIRKNPNDAGPHYFLATNLLNDSARYSEAEEELKEAIRIKPDYDDAYNKLVLLLQRLKRYPEAEKELRKAIRIEPNNARFRNDLGNLLYFLKRHSEAKKEYRTAIKIKPDYAEAHNNLGTLLYDLKNYPAAESEYQTAIKINPDYTGAHINLGTLLYDLKNYPAAESEYQTAIKLNPDDAKVYVNLGLLYIKIGKKEEAKKELQKAKELFKKMGKEEDVKKVEDILKNLG